MFPTKYDPKAIKREMDKVNIIAGGVYQIQDEIISINVSLDDASASVTQLATVVTDGDYALAQLITNLTADVGDNNAAIANELIVRADEDSAIASTITTLTATVDNNTGSIVQEATTRSTADEVITLISDTQRALFGATVSDNWDPNKTYNGSTDVVGGNIVGTGDDTVYGGVVYRCKTTHSNQIPPNTIYWDDVDTVYGTVTAAVLVESTARASADTAQAQTSTAISGRVTTLENDTTDADAASVNAADIITVNGLVVTNDSAYAERFELTAARFGITVDDTYDNARTYQVGEEVVYNAILYRCTNITLGNVPTDTLFWAFQELIPAAISAAVQTEATARATAVSALASEITTVTATAAGNTALITTEATARATAVSALASEITTVTATAAGNTAQITIEATASASADSLLQIDVDGAIAAASASQSTADGKIDSFYQTTAPTVASEGDIWFDTDDGNTIYTYQSGVWTLSADSDIALAILDASNAQSTADGKVTSFYSNTAPTAEGIGDFWVDTDDGNKLYRWSGSSWVDVRDTGIAGAIADAASAQAAADGKIETFFVPTAPTASGIGDLWFDTDDGNTIYRWNGSAWTLSADSDIAQAIADAAGAQGTADGKVTTFYQAAAPTAEGVGDLWVDTDDGNKLNRWNGSAWINIDNTGIVAAIADAASAQAAADGKIDSYYQATAPTGVSEGDIWFDTDDGNKIYTYRTGVWTITVDTDIAVSIGAAAGAQATADGKVATFYQATAPTAEGSGDLWVDTDDGNKLYRWNLYSWVLVQDTAIPTLEAKYGIELDVNGYITGFSQNNDGTTGTFKILADVFKIIDPAAGAGQAGLDAFTYSGGVISLGTGVKLTADSIDVGTMSADRIQFDGQYLEVVNGFLKVKGAPGSQGPIVVGTATGATEPSATVTRVANGTVNTTLSWSLSRNLSQSDWEPNTPFPITVTLKRAGSVIKTWSVSGIFEPGNNSQFEPFGAFGSLDVPFVDGDTGSGSTTYTMGLGYVNLNYFDIETQVTASASL